GWVCCCLFFFFQAEDGIRDRNVTGVQTCALPISASASPGAVPRTASPSFAPPSPVVPAPGSSASSVVPPCILSTPGSSTPSSAPNTSPNHPWALVAVFVSGPSSASPDYAPPGSEPPT